MDAKDLIPKVGDDIYMTKNYKKLVDTIDSLTRINYPILLVGHAGVGKNVAINVVAKNDSAPVIRVNCSGDMRTSSLLGRITTDKDGKIVWQDGLVTKAIRNGYRLVLDEINSLDSDILFAIHGLLDDGFITIANNSEIIEAHPDFRLYATMNPQTYYGVKTLNQALLDRFAVVCVDFDDQIDKKLMEKLDQPEGVKVALTTLITNIRTTDENSTLTLSQNFGHRTLHNVVKLSKQFDIITAINMAYTNKLPQSEKEPFMALLNDLTLVLRKKDKSGATQDNSSNGIQDDANAILSNMRNNP